MRQLGHHVTADFAADTNLNQVVTDMPVPKKLRRTLRQTFGTADGDAVSTPPLLRHDVRCPYVRKPFLLPVPHDGEPPAPLHNGVNAAPPHQPTDGLQPPKDDNAVLNAIADDDADVSLHNDEVRNLRQTPADFAKRPPHIPKKPPLLNKKHYKNDRNVVPPPKDAPPPKPEQPVQVPNQKDKVCWKREKHEPLPNKPYPFDDDEVAVERRLRQTEQDDPNLPPQLAPNPKKVKPVCEKHKPLDVAGKAVKPNEKKADVEQKKFDVCLNDDEDYLRDVDADAADKQRKLRNHVQNDYRLNKKVCPLDERVVRRKQRVKHMADDDADKPSDVPHMKQQIADLDAPPKQDDADVSDYDAPAKQPPPFANDGNPH